MFFIPLIHRFKNKVKMSEYIYEEDTYKIIGALIEVHKNLGKGFSEIVYKDAFEYELNKINFHFEREKNHKIIH